MGHKRDKKITSLKQLKYNKVYTKSDFTPVAFDRLLKEGFIYEFRRGKFKKL